jgi:three-Cys-motif partner protein
MAAPRETVWELEPHTRAKHELLKRYLQAWMIILSQGKFAEILYIDGFAGPGEYAGGEAGSPIIALDTALEFKPPLTAKVHFLFVEERDDRADHLRKQVALRTLPANFSAIVEGGVTFEAAFEKRYSGFVRNGRLMPTFAFIDPFGWTGAPFSLVKKILAQRSCEVFVNFMYEEINRFIGHPQQVANFNSFFGTDDWKQCVAATDPQTRNRCLHDLYLRQLHTNAGAAYVRSFEMSNARDVTDYYLFYGTNELLGLKKMKEAMWRTDESGEFRFSDATDSNQLVLFEKAPKLPALRARLLAEFSGKEVSVADIEKFVLVETAFRETHYKGILKALEKEAGLLKVIKAAPDRRAGTFGDPWMVVRFG